ncbi:MAG: hypothetical protein CVU41_06280 [Chloroflexi bacterium HGW-Chloroflexi-3]|nr:MAG: hypothetical protein CVU41_06280 [Chloroflexi bacterium HGW-Chloroflexi-3]
MKSDLIEKLNTYFGFSSFRPGQEEAIQSLLSGKHTVAVMPTGSGKSLIFQLAALHHPGTTLVISPLIALMKDQVDSLEKHGISATFINSSISISEQSLRLKGMSDGKYRIVYLAPERLRNVRFLESIRRIKVSLLAVDEAHCISEWGHDFRPDYLHIAKFREVIGFPITVALTATATPQVQTDISRLLQLDKPTLIVNGFNRPNLVLTVRHVLDPIHRYSVLREALLNQSDGATIIYTGTRRDTEDVAEFVQNELGLNACYYHAGLDNEKRTQIQNAFIFKKLSVIVATNAFGMGIDRSDVRQVIHFSMPGSLESYYQEAGRAGRDGMPAKALLLYNSDDRALQEFFIRISTISKDELLKIYNALNANNHQEVAIAGEALSLRTGLNDIKIRVGLSTLEQIGIVDRLGDDGSQMILMKNKWQEERINQAVLRFNQQQTIKAKQLQSMIQYAESDQCRRNIILRYFGDKSYVAVDVCCDNCIGRKAIQKSSPVVDYDPDLIDPSLMILETIHQIKNDVGIVKIAQILKGSKNKEIIHSNLDKLPQYGKLSGITIGSIRTMVEQMIKEQYIKVTGGEYPVLRLSHAGVKALNERTPINLKSTQISKKMKPTAKVATQKSSDTVEQTYQLIMSGLTIDQIAEKRSFAVGTIFTHLSILIKKGKIKVESIVPEATIILVKKAIAETGHVNQLSLIKERLPDDIDYNIIRCVVEDWKIEHQENRSPVENKISGEQSEKNKIVAFLSKDHPRQLSGPWDAGWALGFHSSFHGSAWKRSPVGEMAFQLKYQADFSVIQALIQKMKELVQTQPEIAQVDAIIPVPSSVQREKDPVSALTQELARQLKVNYWPVLAKSRKTDQQKQFQTLAQKKANVAGAFRLQTSIKGKRLLVVDDLFDSGATLEEITKLLKQAGADTVNVLTITRTIHSEH